MAETYYVRQLSSILMRCDVTIAGRMHDDATGKQAKVVVGLARIVAGKDAEVGERYGV